MLIPRPETEFLVIALLDLAKPRTSRSCRSATWARAAGSSPSRWRSTCPARLTAIDCSAEAPGNRPGNAAAHGVGDRIEFVQSDLFSALPADRRFHFVVSNPPYVSQAEFAAAAAGREELRAPRSALVAGPRGTEVIEALLPEAAARLLPGGHLLLEISPMIHDAVRSLIAADARFQLGPTTNDLAGLPRVVQALKVGCEARPPSGRG